MVASVSSMCSRRASYERKRRRAGGSHVGMRGPKDASSGALSSLALAEPPSRDALLARRLAGCDLVCRNGAARGGSSGR
eukprot:3668722-Pleurochrysis_carterae.AAC.2